MVDKDTDTSAPNARPAGRTPRDQALYGVALTVLAMIAFSVMTLFIRLATETVHVLEVVFFRNFLAVLILAPPMLLSAGVAPLRTKRLNLHIARNAVGSVAMICGFTAVSLAPLAETQALSFMAPLFATIGAALFLSERIRTHRITALAVGFVGLAIVVAPSFGDGPPPSGAVDGWYEVGLALAVASALLVGVAMLLMKRLAQEESAVAVALWMVLMQTPISFGPALFVWTWPSLEAWGYMIAMAASGSFAHSCLTRAAAFTDMSAMQPFEFVKLPLTALWGYWFLAQTPSTALMIGGSVIFASTLYIAQREARLGLEKPPRSITTGSAP